MMGAPAAAANLLWEFNIAEKKDGKYFLASKIGENSIYADISAWAGRGRKREYALDKLKESINDLS